MCCLLKIPLSKHTVIHNLSIYFLNNRFKKNSWGEIQGKVWFSNAVKSKILFKKLINVLPLFLCFKESNSKGNVGEHYSAILMYCVVVVYIHELKIRSQRFGCLLKSIYCSLLKTQFHGFSHNFMWTASWTVLKKVHLKITF